MIQLRFATAADIADLADLFAYSVKAIAPQRYSPEQVHAWSSFPVLQPDTFRDFILQATTFVAEDEAGIAGFGGIAADGHVTALYVQGDRTRQGIGSRLLRAIVDYAQTQAMQRLYCEASEFSKPVFERCGFTVYASETVERNSVSFDRYLMECYILQR